MNALIKYLMVNHRLYSQNCLLTQLSLKFVNFEIHKSNYKLEGHNKNDCILKMLLAI